ncbi:malonate decarboxylase holo-[acyl-carrier-protein] synthase [Acinetobacter tandoii]|uniref:Malonate decarboxylase holo-[acyl-carrier-protein] synthase n=1 Tax=Acinetobacter tandoii DSM 14970 = CIP 107469 TaxID=1120927 RepID=R9B2C3_9GAMM|nr:malonate decarboxylase holo-[acyl-carrier-protein] synthase [Acinetobacter tandoii]EOR08572.1 malonate decarboxylase holo-[acyl-carrier-protein] synthase [Acinetobacter tandoii DSM 14970 = CIP 107469]
MDRHDLAYLHPVADLHFLDSSLPEPARQKVYQLLQQSVPMTICRQDNDDAAQVKLAINCLVEGCKYRVACLVEADEIQLITRPLSLHTLLIERPQSFQDAALHDFAKALVTLNCEVYVYGSYAYEYLTQEAYVRVSSDLDLVLYPQDMSRLADILQLIQKTQTLSAVRLDGEIKIHPDWHVSFNELLMIYPEAKQSIIGKALQHVDMLKLEQLLEWNLEDANCTEA